MIYLNNAATTWPKPDAVAEAMATTLHQSPPNAYRSTDNAADTLGEVLRKRLATLLGIPHPNRIFLSSGATDSLNRLLTGLPLAEKRILVTATEHNSVLRPLWNHPQLRRQTEVIPCDKYGKVHITAVEDMLKKSNNAKGGLLVVNHCSNVTGCIQEVASICHLAHHYGMLVLVDVSQSAGCTTVDAAGWDCDALVFTGHKSMLGPQGIGGYYLRPEIPLIPLLYGGTGRDSSRLTYEDGDYEYEVGTPNAPGMAGLLAAIDYIQGYGIERIKDKMRRLTHLLINELCSINGVTVYSQECHVKNIITDLTDERQGPVVSFNIHGLTASDAGYILANSYDIILRSGLHCSPLIHRYLGTAKGGTLRTSLSVMNTEEDVRALVDAVRELLVDDYRS